MQYNIKNIPLLHILDENDKLIILGDKKFRKDRNFDYDNRDINETLLSEKIVELISTNKKIKFPISETEYITINNWNENEVLSIVSSGRYNSDRLSSELNDILSTAVYLKIEKDKAFRKKVVRAFMKNEELIKGDTYSHLLNKLTDRDFKDILDVIQIKNIDNSVAALGYEVEARGIDIDYEYINEILITLTEKYPEDSRHRHDYKTIVLQYLIYNNSSIDNIERVLKFAAILKNSDKHIFSDSVAIKTIPDDSFKHLVKRAKIKEPLIVLEAFRRGMPAETFISSTLINTLSEMKNIFTVYPQHYAKEINAIAREFLKEEKGYEYFFDRVKNIALYYSDKESGSILREMLDGNMDVFNKINNINQEYTLEYVELYYKLKGTSSVMEMLRDTFNDNLIRNIASANFNTSAGILFMATMMFFNKDIENYDRKLIDEIFSRAFKELNRCTAAEKRKTIDLFSFIIHSTENKSFPNVLVDSFLEQLDKSYLRKATIEAIFNVPTNEYIRSRWSLESSISNDKFFGMNAENMMEKIKECRYYAYVSAIILINRLGD
jgi:hypothetical protein